MKLKRVLLLAALVAAAGGAVQSVRQFVPPRTGDAQVMESLEATLPKDVAVQVDVETPPATTEVLTAREQRDQIRDWLLLTVLTTAGLDPEKLNEVTFDLPPVRYHFMQGIGDWEFGDVRSRAVGNGTVIALIPARAGARRIEYLSDIADQNRKNLGQRPARVVVIEYEMDGSLAAATLTRRETVDGHALFTEAFGYVERPVTTLEELQQFQGAVDDLTFAAVRDGAIHLGGRRIPGRPIRGIRTEDVAALWQAEQKLSAASAEFEAFLAQKQRELEDRWKDRTYRTGDVAAESRLRRELQADQAAVAEEVSTFRKKRGIADSLGFSLDPAYDFERMAGFVEAVLPRLPVDASRRTHGERSPSAYPELLPTIGIGSQQAVGTLPFAEVAQVAAGLRNGSTRLFFEALQKLEGTLGEQFYEECERRFGLQAARYDGDLQYTEPGMVLFYTDLLAKLWAMDFASATQDVAIEDFVPLTRVKLSPVFRTELEELRHTRLWFGPQNKGFQISADKEVFFARVATRLYAASATSLKQGEESAPNAQTASFLGWWDDHFEEVARFEPEYERLNEIMKWSLVLGWLHRDGDLQALSYLQTVDVPRANWFPDWVRRHPELRFRQWEKVPFFPRGSFGVTTEALPRLVSPEYERFGRGGHYLAGGVSLASRATFAERPLLSTRVAEPLRRANVRYPDSLGNSFKTLDGVEYAFTRTLNRYEVTIKPGAGMRLRGRVGELAHQPINRTLEARAGRFEYRAVVGDADIGSLGIGRTANGFRVGWTSRDVDAAYSLARRLSTSRNVGDALARDGQVVTATRLPDGTYVARLRGSNRWVRFAEEQKPTSKIDGEWQARVAGYEKDSRSVKFQWVDDAWVRDKAGSGTFDELVLQAQGRRTPGEDVADLIYRRDFRDAARRIAHDPVGVRAELEAVYRNELARADDLVRQGRPAEAAEQLARMEQVWGPTHDVSVRRAIAHVDANDLGKAARTIDRAPGGPGRSVEQVYEELARRIERSAPGPQAETWEALRSVTEWKAVGTGGRPVLVAGRDRLVLEYRLAGAAGTGRRVPVDQAIRSGGPVYVQDSPQLQNLDWSVDVHRTLRQAVDGDLVAIVRLPRTDVAHFRPAKIYGEDGTTTLKRVDSASSTRAGANAYRAFRSSGCYSGNGDRTAAGPECPEDRQAVYLVVPKGEERSYE